MIETRRHLAGALNWFQRTPFIAEDVYLPLLSDGLTAAKIIEPVFNLEWCPKVMAPRSLTGCDCEKC